MGSLAHCPSPRQYPPKFSHFEGPWLTFFFVSLVEMHPPGESCTWQAVLQFLCWKWCQLPCRRGMGRPFPSQRIVFCGEVCLTAKYPRCWTFVHLVSSPQPLQETLYSTLCSLQPSVCLWAKLGRTQTTPCYENLISLLSWFQWDRSLKTSVACCSQEKFRSLIWSFFSSPCGNAPSKGILDLAGLLCRVSPLQVFPATLQEWYRYTFPFPEVCTV